MPRVHREVAAQFDAISTVYDRTREPLAPEAIDALARAFARAGVHSLLEIGVGTGRIARPLGDRGLAITGLDISRGMLREARSKGLRDLLRGRGERLPFRDRSFDAVLMVHVLHLLDDPGEVLGEGERVGRVGAFALVHARPAAPVGAAGAGPESVRHVLREVLEEMGYPNTFGTSGPWTREPRILEQHPPRRLETITDEEVTESLGSSLDRLALRGHRGLLDVPREVLGSAIAVARERVGDRTNTYRRVERLAFWEAARPPGDRGGGSGPA